MNKRGWAGATGRRMLPVALSLIAAGCIEIFPHAIEVSQYAYDFGMSSLPWTFEVWTDNEHVQTLRFTVEASPGWLLCEPRSGISTGPDDRRLVTVRVDRTKLDPGVYEGTLTVSAFGLRSQQIAITVESDGALAGTQLHVTNVARSFTSPYLLDFTFSLRNQASKPVIAEPAQFDILCLEDAEAISPSETGAHLARASDKQLKVFLVLDYTASMADPALSLIHISEPTRPY